VALGRREHARLLGARRRDLAVRPPAAAPDRQVDLAGLELDPDAVADLGQREEPVLLARERHGRARPVRELAAQHLGHLRLDQPELVAAADRVDGAAVLAEEVLVQVLGDRDGELFDPDRHRNNPAGMRPAPAATSPGSLSAVSVKSWVYSERPRWCVTLSIAYSPLVLVVPSLTVTGWNGIR